MSFVDRQLLRPVWPYTLNQGSPQAQGLLAWYPMAHPWGRRIFDLSSGRFTLDANGARWDPIPQVGIGWNGGASVTASSGTVPVTATPITISFWTLPFAATDATLCSLGNAGAGWNAWYLELESGLWKASTGANNVTFAKASSTTTGAVGKLAHITAVYASPTSRKIYVNGILEGTESTSVTPAGSGNIFRIGQALSGGGAYNGAFSDIRVYTRALADYEVAGLYLPDTRYDLYFELGRKVFYFNVSTVNLAGTITPAGALLNQDNKTLTGTLAPSGSILKQTARRLTGTITPTSILANLKATLRTFTGSITPTSNLIRTPGKALTGSLTPFGDVLRRCNKVLTGTLTPVGAVSFIKNLVRTFTGSITPLGTLIRQPQKTLLASITPSSTLRRFSSKLLFGISTLIGTANKVITAYGTPETFTTVSDSAVTNCTVSDEIGG